MPVDAMCPKYDFEKNFRVIRPDRENWLNGLLIKANMVWYTDDSKTEQGSEAGIYRRRATKTIIRLGTHATVFRSEITAIVPATKELMKQYKIK